MRAVDEILSRLVELLSQEGGTCYARVLEIRRLQFVRAPGEVECKDVAIDILNLALRQTGIEYTHIYNHRRFSARAAFEQSELQIRSAGSFLLGGGIYLA